MNRTMKFSWKALILAPLPIPLVFSALFEISTPGRSPIFSFLFFFVLGSVLSYGVTIFLFLPCLFLVSRLTSLTASLTGLIGTVLGCLVYFPVAWQFYLSSGVDSGRRQEPLEIIYVCTVLSGISGIVIVGANNVFVVLVFGQPMAWRKCKTSNKFQIKKR